MVSPVTTLSPSLSETADGNYGPVLPFVPDPQRDIFGQDTSRLPTSHTKCKWLFFLKIIIIIKMEVKECTVVEMSTTVVR